MPPEDGLVYYPVGSGWKPLCNLLGLDVPDVPYPWGNTSDEFDDNIERVTAHRAETAA